jgi:rubrerythrin
MVVVRKRKAQVKRIVKHRRTVVALKNGRDKGVCTTCGYAMIWLHNGDCPLCKVCVRCGNRVRHCNCMEGE